MELKNPRRHMMTIHAVTISVSIIDVSNVKAISEYNISRPVDTNLAYLMI
jgi:hypothetical protein